MESAQRRRVSSKRKPSTTGMFVRGRKQSKTKNTPPMRHPPKTRHKLRRHSRNNQPQKSHSPLHTAALPRKRHKRKRRHKTNRKTLILNAQPTQRTCPTSSARSAKKQNGSLVHQRSSRIHQTTIRSRIHKRPHLGTAQSPGLYPAKTQTKTSQATRC